ncbi:uncharacterized protein LOC135384370 [Ornithodoros turicata]|uniref:uncharacterized protein LOC135384370 n=1 Tax=Ornithodoros turicata TaxID=34597 RepID=UPI003138938A
MWDDKQGNGSMKGTASSIGSEEEGSSDEELIEKKLVRKERAQNKKLQERLQDLKEKVSALKSRNERLEARNERLQDLLESKLASSPVLRCVLLVSYAVPANTSGLGCICCTCDKRHGSVGLCNLTSPQQEARLGLFVTSYHVQTFLMKNTAPLHIRCQLANLLLCMTAPAMLP